MTTLTEHIVVAHFPDWDRLNDPEYISEQLARTKAEYTPLEPAQSTPCVDAQDRHSDACKEGTQMSHNVDTSAPSVSDMVPEHRDDADPDIGTPEQRVAEIAALGDHFAGGCDTPEACTEQIAPTIAADLALAEMVNRDLLVYGTACQARRADGSVERIPPEMVRLEVTAALEADR